MRPDGFTSTSIRVSTVEKLRKLRAHLGGKNPHGRIPAVADLWDQAIESLAKEHSFDLTSGDPNES